MRFSLYAILVLGISALICGQATAETCSDAITNLVKAVRDKPSTPEAELAVLDILDSWNANPAGEVVGALEEVLKIPRLSVAARERARTCLAQAELRRGDHESAQKSWDDRGFISEWLVAGPFDNEGGTGFDAPLPALEIVTDAVDIENARYDGKHGPVTWRSTPPEISSFGLVRFDSMVATSGVCMVSATSLNARRSGKGFLRVGAGGAVRAFWNGREAFADEAYRRPDPDRHLVPVSIREGDNRLVVQICSDEAGVASLHARVTLPDGSPFPLVSSTSTGGPLSTKVKGRSNAPGHDTGTLQKLMKRARRKNATPEQMSAASRFAFLTGALHPGSHEERDLARRSCEARPSAGRCMTWATTASDRNERRLAVTRALDANPKHVPALVEMARLLREGPRPMEARAYLDRALTLAPDSPTARLATIELEAAQGFQLTALASLEKLRVALPHSVSVLEVTARIAENLASTRVALEAMKRLDGLRWDDADRKVVLARAAAARSDTGHARQLVEEIRVLASHERTSLWDLAELLEMLGDVDGARAALSDATELCSRDADALKTLALFQIRHGDSAAGLKNLELARRIRPQDAWLADYLEHHDPAPRFQQAHVVLPEDFLALRKEGGEDLDARYLVDSTVVRVFETGLSSTFSQTVVEINSRESARQWRQFSVQFSMTSQRATLLEARVFHPDGTVEQSTGRGTAPISEPWYRLYYDMAAEVVELPPLSEGDVVEFQFRVDDTAHHNVFADYFGDLVSVEDSIPKALWKYVLISPASRPMTFGLPDRKDLERTSKKNGEDLVEIFSVSNVMAVLREPKMPGQTAGLSFLHISTYSSWDDLGAWYKGLVRNQMLADERIASTARKLTRGMKTEREKVAAIYGWVVSSTRYVGLEFGIHGYKPYRAPLVVSRGFGDCKDKASLLVTMLGVVGVDAQFALVRTRSAGDIASSPASLSVFNHAIAYVPSLDLWLDGTAEHHGTGDFPFQDQGIVSLRLTPEGVEFGETPVMPPDSEVMETSLNVLLDPDGDAKIEVTSTATGAANAPLMRREFETDRTRRERFESSLVKVYPGARLGELEFTSLDDPEKPVEYQFTAFVPRFAETTREGLDIPVGDGLDLVKTYAVLPSRERDLIVGPRRISRRTMRVTIPGRYRVGHLPSAAIIESPFGRFSMEANRVGGDVVVSRTFELLVERVPAGDYAEFAEFCKEVDSIVSGDISLEERK